MTIDFGRVRLDDVWETLETLLQSLWFQPLHRGAWRVCPCCAYFAPCVETDEPGHSMTCALQGLWWPGERRRNDLEALR